MTDPTTPKDGVLGLFRGVAENLAAAAGKAAAREQELNDAITSEFAELAPLVEQQDKLNAVIAERRERLAGLQAERDDAHANAATAAQQGAYAQSVIALAEKSATETITDGQVAQP